MRHSKKPLGVEGKASRKALLMIALGAFCLGTAFLVVAMLLASCSGSVSSTIDRGGGARISVRAELPPSLSARFRKLAATGGTGASQSFFDTAAIRKSIAARPGMSLLEIEAPKQDAIRLEIAVRSLEELAASPDLAHSGLITLARGSGWAELRLRFARESAKALYLLLPGMDPHLMDALSPPALEEDPLTEAEYKTMLKSLIGTATMPAMETAAITVALAAPGPVLASGGGSLSGSTLTAHIPVIQALALEKPIELWLRWKQNN
jgi:hypothetical protein